MSVESAWSWQLHDVAMVSPLKSRPRLARSRLCCHASGKGQPQNQFSKAFRKLLRQIGASVSALQGTSPVKRDPAAAARQRHMRRNLRALRTALNDTAQDALWIGVLVLLAGRHGLDVREGATLDTHLLQVRCALACAATVMARSRHPSVVMFCALFACCRHALPSCGIDLHMRPAGGGAVCCRAGGGWRCTRAAMTGAPRLPRLER